MSEQTVLTAAVRHLEALLEGRIPLLLEMPETTPEEAALVAALNRLTGHLHELRRSVMPLVQGELRSAEFSADNYLASPLRELRSRLLHLTWQAEQVTAGDYAQRVDFMGDISEAFNRMVEALAQKEQELHAKIEELNEVLARVKRLEGMLPICSYCKKILSAESDPWRQDNWEPIEKLLNERTDAQLSHGMCPACMKEHFPDVKQPHER